VLLNKDPIVKAIKNITNIGITIEEIGGGLVVLYTVEFMMK